MAFLFETVLPSLLTGALVTITVTIASLALALALGFGLALLRQFLGFRVLSILIDIYTEYFRNIPALTHLFIIYFGLAAVGLRLSSLTAAIFGLGLVGAAITCEVFRSGFIAVKIGQTEAARAVGMTPMQTIWLILAPQAIRISLPPLGNYALQLMKDTSIVSAIAAPEIMFNARSMVTSSFQTTLIYTTAAMIYLLISLPMVHAISRLEARFGRRN